MTDTISRDARNSGKHLLPTSFRALIIAAGYWVLSLSLTNLSGSVAAIIGAVAACVLADQLFSRTLLRHSRTPVILAGCALLLAVGLTVSSSIVGSTFVAGILSPLVSYQASEFIKWLFISAAITSARLSSLPCLHTAMA